MLTVVWSVKGGVGASVAAASLARAGSSAGECLLVDFGGDQSAILGVPEPSEPTLAEWVESPNDVAHDSLRRIETAIAPNLSLLQAGAPEVLADGIDRLRLGLQLLRVADRHVVIDLGRISSLPEQVGRAVLESVGEHGRSLLVTTPCYLSLRRAQAHAHRATGVVLIDDPSRALRKADVEACLPTPVVATIPHLPTISRAIDAGLLVGRFPSPMRRALKEIA